MHEWKVAKPLLTETQLRILVAIRDGHRTQAAISKVVHRTTTNISSYYMPPLKAWGLIRYSYNGHVWCLTRPWPEVVEEVKKRTDSLLRQYREAIDELLEAELGSK